MASCVRNAASKHRLPLFPDMANPAESVMFWQWNAFSAIILSVLPRKRQQQFTTDDASAFAWDGQRHPRDRRL